MGDIFSMSDVEKTFVSNFRKLRVEKGYTHESLGEALDVSHATISRWESGRNKPSYSDFLRISEVFGVSPADLVGDDWDSSAPTIHDSLSMLAREFGYQLRAIPGAASREIVNKANLDLMSEFDDKSELNALLKVFLETHVDMRKGKKAKTS
jgi:transcriptional regulator with XRE-family HTH domain